ncbi:hypothetical protein ACHQM5_001479 [Ranunculus cassubicifolius]
MPTIKGAKEFVYGGKDVAFAPYGEYWRQMKKICVTDLLSVKRVQSFRYVREEITDMVNNIKGLCLLGMDVKIGDLLAGVTNNIISRATFGKRLEGRERTELIKEMDMVTGGTKSISTTLEWIMAELLIHPNVMNKLQEGVRRIVGTKGRIDEDDISQMDYVKCVIKESPRLHSPTALSLPRVSTTSTDIEGYHIPAKTRVIVNI